MRNLSRTGAELAITNLSSRSRADYAVRYNLKRLAQID